MNETIQAGIAAARSSLPDRRRSVPSDPGARRARGQVLPLLALSMFVLVGIMAVVIDVSWYWSNTLRVQRAADAAALAGAVWLPGDVPKAYSTARQEATKNGYTAGSGITVTPIQDSQAVAGGNPNQLDVTVSAPVGTFFMRVFGITNITATRSSKAEYVQAVPMGSPLNYYGVYKIRTPSDPTGSKAGTWPAGATVPDAIGGSLASQGFWGTIISEGANMVNGDAYAAKWNPSSPTTNTSYDPNAFYQYGVEFPAGTGNGTVWIFDPVFCASKGDGSYGTGDRWFSGSAGMSTIYELYDTRNTPNTADDTLVATSGNLFRNVRASDSDLGGPSAGGGISDCRYSTTKSLPAANPLSYHLKWYALASGLAGGEIYRLHVTTTDDANNQGSTDGHNSFSLEATASGSGTPRVYGLGTMEAFSPLNGGGATIFYLAQIEARHAGKTMQISLYDPGDTGSLSANLQILQPAAGGYSPATFSYKAQRAASSGVNCGSRSGTNVNSVTTASGGTSYFNGCWLTITIVLPATYSAPQPPGEPGPGWWKIKYNMSGSSSDTAFDLTTWKVALLGNPVHLVVP